MEVAGLVGDLRAYEVVERPADVRRYDHPRLGLVCQTTTAPTEAERIRAAVERLNPDAEIRFVDTICHPTRTRQQAVQDILPAVEALVVVGGRSSNNTRKLGELAGAVGIPWFHVETAAEVDAAWGDRFRVVGLTAGTSTPDATIHEVHRALLRLGVEAPCTSR